MWLQPDLRPMLWHHQKQKVLDYQKQKKRQGRYNQKAQQGLEEEEARMKNGIASKV